MYPKIRTGDIYRRRTEQEMDPIIYNMNLSMGQEWDRIVIIDIDKSSYAINIISMAGTLGSWTRTVFDHFFILDR